MKITKEILETQVQNLNGRLPATLCLDFVCKGVRLCKQTENGGLINLSPIVSNSEMSNILDTLYTTVVALR